MIMEIVEEKKVSSHVEPVKTVGLWSTIRVSAQTYYNAFGMERSISMRSS